MKPALRRKPDPYAQAEWRMLGSPLAVRLSHLRPGTRPFAVHLGEIRVMVAAAERDHRAALPKRPDDSPLFAAPEHP